MVIRTFKRQNYIKKNLIIFFGIIIVAFIVAKISTTIYSKKFLQEEQNKNRIGTTITFKGKITNENNFPLYTHKITNKNGYKVFIKSSKINLNKLDKEIEIYGEIINKKNNIPIIDVESIKYPEKNLIIKNNTYFFVKDMILLDFSNQNILSANKKDKEIEVFYNEEKIFSIEHFLCNRVLRQKDCSSLIQDYTNNEKENFDSYRGYSYYKHESGLRITFDGNMFGYLFKNIDEQTMLDISSMIRIIDKDYILETQQENILKECKKLDKTIENIDESNIEYQNDNNINIIIKDKKSSNYCKISFDIRNEWNISNSQLYQKN